MENIYLFNDDISVLQTFMFGHSEISIIHTENRTENRLVVQQKYVENTIKVYFYRLLYYWWFLCRNMFLNCVLYHIITRKS